MRNALKAAFFAAASMLGLACTHAEVDMKSFPSPTVDLTDDSTSRSVVLAGGCFWCTEGVYRQLPGVTNVLPGYSGGSKETADYESVCSGTTGHAEAIQITYDPRLISYGQLLKVFFSIAHDPTQLNRQGNDIGSQYRSAIFYANDDEQRVASAYIKQLDEAKVFGSPIVTKLEKLNAFYVAEDYHKDYVRMHPNQPYVCAVALPKVEKAKKYVAQMTPATQPAK